MATRRSAREGTDETKGGIRVTVHGKVECTQVTVRYAKVGGGTTTQTLTKSSGTDWTGTKTLPAGSYNVSAVCVDDDTCAMHDIAPANPITVGAAYVAVAIWMACNPKPLTP